MPAGATISVNRRTNYPPVMLRPKDKNGNALPFADSYVLTIDVPGAPAVIVRTYPGDLVLDSVLAAVVWPYTIEDSLKIPLGRGSRYELMGTYGSHTVRCAGGEVRAESFRS